MLFKNLNKFQNEIAIVDDNIKKKYKDLEKDIKSVCKNFEIKKKKLCFIIVENSYDFIQIYISLIKLDYVLVILDSKVQSSFIKNLINFYKPNFIFFPKKYDLNYKKVKVITPNYLVYENSTFVHNFNKQIQLLLPTSGTTGSLKFVMLTKENMLKNTKDIISYLKLNKKDTTISNLPFHYSYGLSILNTHLSIGGKLIIFKDGIISNSFKNFFKNEQINCFYGVPENYEIIKRLNLNFKKSFKFFAIAGGKISKATLSYLINLAAEYKITLFNMYGQTEASPRISYSSFKSFKDKKNIFTSGKTFGGGKVIIKNNNKKLKKNEIGKIYFHGKNVMLGYANSYKDLSNKRQNNYILDTGDIGFLDDNNNLNIVGRADRYVKLDSERINLNDIEDMLSSNFKNKYHIVYMNNKINILLEEKNSNGSEIQYLSSKMKIKKNYLRIYSNFKFSFLSNGKLNISKIKKDLSALNHKYE